MICLRGIAGGVRGQQHGGGGEWGQATGWKGAGETGVFGLTWAPVTRPESLLAQTRLVRASETERGGRQGLLHLHGNPQLDQHHHKPLQLLAQSGCHIHLAAPLPLAAALRPAAVTEDYIRLQQHSSEPGAAALPGCLAPTGSWFLL